MSQGSPPTGPQSGLARIPALDGIRALAIVGVVAFHLGIGSVPGGFLGVDTFFALSGFLITSLLLQEAAGPGSPGSKGAADYRLPIHLGAFWGRRARRLLPALFLMLMAVLIYAGVAHLSRSIPTLHGDALATLFYYANWHAIATQTNYFAVTAHPSPLLHTWSLAIEEQFYLVWPLLLTAVFAGKGRVHRRIGALFALCIIAAGASTLWMVHVFDRGAGLAPAYYSTFTRAQSLLFGAALSAVVALLSRRASRAKPIGIAGAPGASRQGGAATLPALAGFLLGIAGLAGTVACFMYLQETDRFTFRGGFAATALAACALIASVMLAPRGPVARFLSLPPVAYLGRISYGVYLWHMPVRVFMTHATTGMSDWSLQVARLGVILAVSITSFHLVEMPIRRGLLRSGSPTTRGASARWVFGATAPSRPAAERILSPGRVRARQINSPGRVRARRVPSVFRRAGGRHVPRRGPYPWLPEVSTLFAGVSACCIAIFTIAVPAPIGTHVSRDSRAVAARHAAPLTSAQERSYAYIRSVASLAPNTRLLVLGDSMALTLGLGLGDEASRNNTWLFNDAIVSCSVAVEGPYQIEVTQFTPPSTCGPDTSSPSNWRALWQQWIDQFDPDVVVYLARNDLTTQLHNGQWEHVGESDFDSYLTANLDEAVSILGSRGAKVVLLTTPYYDSGEQPNGQGWPEDSPVRVDAYNALVRQVAASFPGTASVVDLNALACPNGRFQTTVGGVDLRADDGVHFTEAGGQWLAGQILPGLYQLGRPHHAATPLGNPPSPPPPST